VEERTILLLGGDARMAELGRLFWEAGYSVFMLGWGENLPPWAREPEPDGRYDAFVGPTPGSRDGMFWNTPMAPNTMPLTEEWPGRCKQAWFFGKPEGFSGVDLMGDETFLQKNARLTAAGMVRILLERGEKSPSDEKILILGYGRIGKHLSRMLRSLGAEPTVTLRKEIDRAFAGAQGQTYVEFDRVGNILPEATVIINTIPKLPTGSLPVENIRPDARIYDLAPGSLKTACPGLEVADLPGIPGRFYPMSAARAQFFALRNAMACQMKKEGQQWI